MSFVKHLRDAAPYIQAHRNNTVVLWLPGELLDGPQLPQALLNDILLLHHLGSRVVLVHGSRPQIERNLKAHNITSEFSQGWRVSTSDALDPILAATGHLRIKLESKLSMGLVGHFAEHQAPAVMSGNVVTAKPVGVRNGIDMQHTGEVREINNKALHKLLDNSGIALLSPVGHSATGDVFNLNSVELAVRTAAALQADKLVMLADADISAQNAINSGAATQLSAAGPDNLVAAAQQAAKLGVSRVHILNGREDGALLQELYTRDGNGLLICDSIVDETRAATVQDIPGIAALIAPLVAQQIIAPRAQSEIEQQIGDYHVMTRDGLVIACAALQNATETAAEVACVAVHDDYRNQGLATDLLAALEATASKQHLQQLYVLTTQTEQWFLEHGFSSASANDLPEQRRNSYNVERNSKVLIKPI